MKVFCVDCGCHFPDEFKQSLKCTFWERRNLGHLSKKNKKLIWDWMFSLPIDTIAIKTKTALHLMFYGTPFECNQFEQLEGYKELLEKDKKAFQKEYFRKALGRDTAMLPDELGK